MSEMMLEDLLMEFDNDGRPPPGPGLIVNEPMDDPTLRTTEKCYREHGTIRPMFVEAPEDDTDAEFWSDGQPAYWRKIMAWPCDPTISEVTAWRLHKTAIRDVDLWSRLFGPVAGQA